MVAAVVAWAAWAVWTSKSPPSRHDEEKSPAKAGLFFCRVQYEIVAEVAVVLSP
jgi:hypothetical protein